MNKISVSQIAESIRPRIPLYLVERKNTEASSLFQIRLHNRRSRLVRQPFRSRSREIYEIVVQSPHPSPVRSSFFVKIHDSTLDAIQEYRNLGLLWESFRSSSAFKVPKPIDFVSDLNAVITAPVGGRNLGEEMRWLRILPFRKGTPGGLLMDTRRAAYWLRYLHNINTVPFADHLRGKSLESRLEGLLATAGRLGLRRDLASKVAVVFDYLKNVAKESRYVLVHSDFAPQHVFLDGKVTSVIDLENLQIGPRAIDFAAFCASIDTMLLPPSSSPYAKLAKSELFQSTAEEIGEEVVRGFYTSIMVEKWVNIMQRLAGGCAPSTYAGLAYLARRILRNVRLSCDERFP